MGKVTAWSSERGRAVGLQLLYAVALIPGSVLAYLGVGWVEAFERGWHTQAAAAALVAAWLALILGFIATWRATRAGRRPTLLSALAFFVALGFYAVAFGWGGRMLI